MPDDLLVTFASEESDGLTAEAKAILEEEIKRRNLLWPLATENTTHHPGFPTNEIWDFALSEKEAGKPNELIIQELLEKGLTEDESQQVMKELLQPLKKIIARYDQAMLMGTFICMSGIAVSLLPMSPDTHRVVYILAYCAVIAGAARFLHGLFYKRRYKKLTQVLEREADTG